jgi:hypothetical protein
MLSSGDAQSRARLDGNALFSQVAADAAIRAWLRVRADELALNAPGGTA